MAVSEAVGRATRENQEVSSAAQAALARASEELLPFRSDPRVAALVEKIAAIASPEDGFAANDYERDADRDGQVADALVKAEEIAKSEASPALRERAASVARDLQLEHLQKWNPRAAAEWQRLHAAG